MEVQPWFRPFRVKWKVDDTEPPEKLLLARVAKAYQGDLSKDALALNVRKLLENGKIGGRQIKVFFDIQGRPLLYSDTDELKLTATELNQFESFRFKTLPRLSTRKHKMPFLRSYMIGIRLEHRLPRTSPRKEDEKKSNEDSISAYKKIILNDMMDMRKPMTDSALRTHVEENRKIEVNVADWNVALQQLSKEGLLQRSVFYRPSPKLLKGEQRTISSRRTDAPAVVKTTQ